MTAKEQLRERIETLSEHEAERTLRLLDDFRDPLAVLLDNAPIDDEPVTAEEEAAVAEVRGRHRGRAHHFARADQARAGVTEDGGRLRD